MIHNKVLLDQIEREKNGIDFCCPAADKVVLQDMLKEINEYAGTDFRYLAELVANTIAGAGSIVARYLPQFSSVSVRSYLIPQLVHDRLPDCDKIVIQSYMHFRASDEYISKPGIPAPAHIYIRYDNALAVLKPKRLKDELVQLVKNPRDAFYLPFTMRMLASWKIPDMKNLLISYLSDDNISAQDVGLGECNDNCFPPLSFMKRELRFTAIDGLKYFPSAETREVIMKYTAYSDSDIKAAAKRTLKRLNRA